MTPDMYAQYVAVTLGGIISFLIILVLFGFFDKK